MKVVFKLSTAAQLFAAQTFMATAEPGGDSDYKEVFCGNLIGWIQDSGFGVSPQSLDLEGKLLTFEGRRTAMINGEGNSFPKIIAVFGDLETANKAVVSYETSDKRLQWHESLETAVDDGRFTAEELFGIAKKFECRSSGYAAERKLLAMAGGREAIELVDSNPRKAAAQWASEDIRFKRRVGCLVGII